MFYFYSFVVENYTGGRMKNTFGNAVTELHPFEAISAMNQSFNTVSIPGMMNSKATLISWRTITEKEYVLFQN